MDFAVVMHTEVNGAVSDLLQQGDKVLPQGLLANSSDGVGFHLTS